jgi:molecular chaperone Hsp33
MSEMHQFLFDGLPVRGQLVRLTESWQEILHRRAENAETGAYPLSVQVLLGEMTAAATLMQALLKFDGDLVLQIFGNGPLKLAVVEVKSDLSLRSTAKTIGAVEPGATLTQMVNVNNQGKCAITLDPKSRFPGQQPYQGVVPLFDDLGQPIDRISEVLEHYMLQSEQLDTKLILAANDKVAAGLLVQRMPVQGEGNLSAKSTQADEDQIGVNEDFKRIAMLASTLTPEELLSMEPDAILHRLFWDEPLMRYEPLKGSNAPRFVCSCSQERVSQMILGLGQEEAESILSEMPNIEVGCEFCGRQYVFDAIDAAQIFTPPVVKPQVLPPEHLH